jgi:hypothetical protein
MQVKKTSGSLQSMIVGRMGALVEKSCQTNSFAFTWTMRAQAARFGTNLLGPVV